MTAPLSPGLRRVALEHFAGRLAKAQQLAADFGESWHGDPVNETLRLWCAIVLAAGAGADLPEPVRNAISTRAIWPAGKLELPRPDQMAETHAWQAELARARDAAIARAEATPEDLRTDQRARDLIALAEALGVPGIDWSPKKERNAA
ncbi:MAG: hypothetical protein ACRDBL_04625 [Rhabdaerophilum sp.]